MFWVLIDMRWKVFLPESYIKRVEIKLSEIAMAVSKDRPTGYGLMGGATGLACFYAYYARHTGTLHFDKLAAEMFEFALNPVAGSFPGFMFSDGLAGIAWTLHHLIDEGLLQAEAGPVFEALDVRIYEAMIQEIRAGNYDFLHAALGMGLYFLRQAERNDYKAYLTELVLELRKNAILEPDGSMKWKSLLDEEQGLIGYNLSLSHGMASIIIMLSKIAENGIAISECNEMIHGGMKYLEKQRLDPDRYISAFPGWALESMEEVQHSRLAWCYGDLGIGLAYESAGNYCKEMPYALHGIEILKRTALRKDINENSVFDAGLCHGAAGIALIYNVLYQRTRQVAFREAASYWLDICLNMGSHKDGVAGYKTWYAPEYGGWKPVNGLLEGAGGIGLALLSFVAEKEPLWTRSLLLM